MWSTAENQCPRIPVFSVDQKYSIKIETPKISASLYMPFRFYDLLKFPEVESMSFSGNVVNFAAILSMQYLRNSLKWVVKISQTEFL